MLYFSRIIKFNTIMCLNSIEEPNVLNINNPYFLYITIPIGIRQGYSGLKRFELCSFNKLVVFRKKKKEKKERKESRFYVNL